MKGGVVQCEEFFEIILDVLEERWLTGKRPDISSLVNADLQAELNRQIVNLAAVARDVGVAIQVDEVDEGVIDHPDSELTELKSVIDEIERRHLEV